MSQSYFIRTDGTSPALSGFRSAFKRADGVVVATDSQDILALLGAGYVPLQAMDGEIMVYGQTRFEFKQHSGLVAVAC